MTDPAPLSPNLPRLLGVIALAALGGVLNGCGGGGTTSAANGSANNGAPITKASAPAYARAVNLRAADLPAMRITSPEGRGKAAGAADHELAACDGGPNPDLVIAKFKSATFTGAVRGEYEVIKSSVEVQPRAALAARNDALILSPRGLSCLARLLPRQLTSSSKSRVRYGRVKVSRLPSPLPGVAGSFGIQIVTSLTSAARAGQPPIPFYLDEYGFVAGQVEISLSAIGAPQAVPDEAATRLLSLLYTRATAG
jgi:hypothetical protein